MIKIDLKKLVLLVIFSWIIISGASWWITKELIKPEKVVVTQEKVIYKLQSQIEIQKVKEEEQYLIKVPFTDIGITKQFCLGAIFDRALVLLL